MKLPIGCTPHDVIWMANKARPNIRNMMANLRKVPGIPHWPCGSFEGSGVVVGAGPSLAANVQDLHEHDYVIAVNTAVPACLAAGRPPDAVLVRECLDLSQHLEGLPEGTEILCDIGCHPDTFARATGWYLSLYPRHVELMHHLGIWCHDAGPSALTAAVSVLMGMGCGEVVLYGADMAIGPDGDVYAPDSAWGGARAYLRDGALHFEGIEAIKAVNETQGQQSSIPDRLVPEQAPGYNGGPPVWTYHTLAEQRRWLEELAERNRGKVWLVNASGSGSSVTGWQEDLDRESIVRARPGGTTIEHLPPISQANVEAYLADVAKQCGVIEHVCHQMLDGSTPEGLTMAPGYAEGGHIIEAYASPAMMEARQLDGTERMSGIYEALRAAAADVRELVE